jgi:hypothetical protein
VKFACVDLPRRRGTTEAMPAPLVAAELWAPAAGMKPGNHTALTPSRYQTWLALTGFTDH